MSNEPQIAGDQLRSVVQRIERLDEEIKDLQDDKKEIYAEAKANGYDTKVLKKVIALRRRDLNERKEEEAILDLYLQAVGETRDTPPPSHARSPARTREDKADLYEAALQICRRDGKVSASYLQRRLQIGYNKAADLVERLEAEGICSKADAAGQRRLLDPEPSGLTGVTVTVAGTGTPFEKAVIEASKNAGHEVVVASPKRPLVGSFTPPRVVDPFGADE